VLATLITVMRVALAEAVESIIMSKEAEEGGLDSVHAPLVVSTRQPNTIHPAYSTGLLLLPENGSDVTTNLPFE